MIYCELFVCMRFVAAGKASVGLGKSPAEIQDEVAKAWLRAHSKDTSAVIRTTRSGRTRKALSLDFRSRNGGRQSRVPAHTELGVDRYTGAI